MDFNNKKPTSFGNEVNISFTFFGKGHWSEKAQKYVPSTKPQMNVDVAWVGNYVLSERAKLQTLELRQMMDTATDQQMRDYKLLQFDAVAAAGVFSYGSAAGLEVRSPYIVIDVDDLVSTDEAREIQQTLIKDKEVVTALCFVSPKGLGVKWWAELPEWCKNMDFREQYSALSRYIGYTYGILADSTGSNVNRLCFLPYDPHCYIHPKYLTNK
ncbi:MAG: hypothetical protein IKW98_13190 [Prevotella sp.]|nr:hypothetical protein [Prevotella sp.]